MEESPISASPSPAFVPPPPEPLAGKEIGRYRLLGKLAEGGMAEVYLARQHGPKGFSKTVVIKKIRQVMAQDQHFVRMFLNEARLAALINHPNVVSIYELGEEPENGAYYIVMEHIDGCTSRTLADELAIHGRRLPPNLAVRIVADSCAGLEFAHNLKGEDGKPLHIVHRDISLENILVEYSGVVKVVDFGLAKATLDDKRTPTGQLKGKFGYLAPELLKGKPVDRRVDVWALGVVLYRLLTGHKPFGGENEGQTLREILDRDPPLDEVPVSLRPILQQVLAKDPDVRYQTAAAFGTALENWLARSGLNVVTSSVAAFVSSVFPESHRDRLTTRALLSAADGWAGSATWIRRRPRVFLGAAAAALAALGWLSYAAWLGPALDRQRVARELALVDERMDHGRLVGPGGDEALDHLTLARRLKPQDPEVSRRSQALSDVLVRLARDAQAHGDRAELAAKLQAALLADPGRAALAQELQALNEEAHRPVSSGSAGRKP
jgi:tRNA A-37 threonylcarbamoyl transferase component Bud32